MKYKDYSSDIWSRIHTTLDQVLKEDSRPVAAFDADGTLWDTDLGEHFFQFQIDNKLLPLPNDPWQHYQDLKKQDPKKGFLWLAQICQGYSLKEIQQWAQRAVEHLQPPVFEEQRKLIDLLRQRGVDVYIVTASIKWAVEPGATLFGLPYEKVLGVETQVKDGLITDQLKGVVTYRHGKVEALLERTNGKRPFLCSGNTMGDFDLLTCASHLQLAVSASNEESRLYETEQELLRQADLLKWMRHRFI